MTEQYQVKPVLHPFDTVVTVPGSKSVMNRALCIAALAKGTTVLSGAAFSEDTVAFIEGLKEFGFAVHAHPEYRAVTVKGSGGRIPSAAAQVDAKSAGTAARFLTALGGFSGGISQITASEQMKKRPMRPLFDALIQAGAHITFQGEEGHLPVFMRGAFFSHATTYEPVKVSLDISQSTQFLSACLLAAPLCRGGITVTVTGPKKEGSYVAITRRMMEDFGVTSTFDGGSYTVAAGSCYENPDGEYAIEPDVSAACYFYAAAALTGSRICVKGIHRDLMQGDLAFLDVLERMGATVSESPDGIILEGAPDGTLHGITVDMNHFSDQALTLAAIAPFADSPVTITGIAHIRGQESDRIQAMEENLDAAGIRTETTNDSITIFPGQPHGCRMKTYQDHRVAMAFSLPGLLVPGVIIDDPGCCKKTFPEYFDVIDIAYY